MVRRSKLVATDPTKIVDDAVHGRNVRQMGGGREAASLALVLGGRVLGHVGVVVRIRGGAVDDRRHHGAARG